MLNNLPDLLKVNAKVIVNHNVPESRNRTNPPPSAEPSSAESRRADPANVCRFRRTASWVFLSVRKNFLPS